MQDRNVFITAVRLKAARRRRGFSREELAVRSGLSWSAIAQIESGRRTNLRPATLVALANALALTVDYLLGSEPPVGGLFEHELLVYAGEDAFIGSAGPFLREGVELGESTLAVTSARKISLLREYLGGDSARVAFKEADGWYESPATALAAYRRFATDALRDGATWVRVLGEPVWSGRTDAERRSWLRYESLLNLAFAELPLTVACAYDAGTLERQVVAQARATHPRMREAGALRPTGEYEGPDEFLLAQ
jgi:transcriptional regulator with XRE-family HTH domain